MKSFHPQAGFPASAPAAASGLPQFNVHTVTSALRCWWHIALPMGLVLAAGAVVAVYYTTTPLFTASAWLLLQERPPSLLKDLALDDPRKFIANQTELMRSPPVLDPVVTIRDVRSAPELVDEEDPVQYLRSHLKVRALGGSDYFVIEFTSEDPVKATRIVNEVAKSYLALQQRHDSRIRDEMVETLQEQQRARQTEIASIRTRLEDWTKQLTGKEAFPVQGAENRSHQSRSKLAELESQLLDAQVAQLTLEAEIKAENDLFTKESFVPPAELVAAHVSRDPKVAGIQALLEGKREKLGQHKERSTNLPKNVLYQQLEKEIADDQASLDKLTADLRISIAADLEKNARTKRQFEIAELQARLVRIAATVDFLQNRLGLEQRDQKQASTDTLKLEFAWADYRRATDLFDAISNRIISMQLEQRAPLRVSLFRDATIPIRPDEEVPYKKMLLAALAAMAIPFGLAVGIEILFRRVSSRAQLESGGQIAVVGEITALPRRIKSRRAQSEPHRDVQLYEESINGLRTYLTLIESARGRRVLAVTSSISREGKTSLAAQLAVSVANSSGKPTLLIDGDMRSPDLHRVFDVECGPGLAEVLAGECPLEEAIETSFSSRLHVLTAGRLGVSPHQLTGAGEFAALVEKLRGMYEHVIIDTPPILSASEALLMARAADATILCVRRDYSRVDQVSEAHARLMAAGVKIAGAVLNGVPTQHYAYRYGSYYYATSRPHDAQVVEASPESSQPTTVA
jgi:polysaccharide biosynthesis transport protein